MRELLIPDQASAYARSVDTLFYFLCAVAVFLAASIAIVILAFVIRYRAGSDRPRGAPVHGNFWLEASWFAVPLVLTMVIFAWGATLYFESATPPADALDIYVVGKQWMWKIQHPDGRREINELHVPIGQPVRLTIASKDVIHSFYIPAFRIKIDAVPGRYSREWFTASKTGTYHLFCAEYCGTNHSLMRGWVTVMEPAAYEQWLEGGGGESMEAAGKRLFESYGCYSCHESQATQRGPSLEGTFGTTVKLAGGASVKIDERYLRESILEPNAKMVAGFDPVMPTFKNQIGEEDLLRIIAYIKSLTHAKEESPQP